MARMIVDDDIDYAAYERMTDAKIKVRPASIYADELIRHFAPRVRGERRPRMTSTKLGGCLEFRPGETTCWAGYNGHRKSMIAGQVSLDLCSQRERTLIASFEMQPRASLGRMAQQAFGVARPMDHQLRSFADWTDERLWLFDHMGRITPAQVLAVTRYFADELDGQHVFIDSMMMVCGSEDHMDEQKQFMTDLVRVGQETGIHVHLIAHCRKPLDESKPPTKYDLRGSAAISDQAHNVCMVWANKAKKAAVEAANGMNVDEKWLEQPDALVCVEKQRNGDYEGKLKLWWDAASFRFTDSRTQEIEPYPIGDMAEEFA